MMDKNKITITTEEYISDLAIQFHRWLISLAEEVQQEKANVEEAQKIVNSDS